MPRTVTIDWGDGTYPEQWTGDKGVRPHRYATEGTFTITATTEDGVQRQRTVTIPCGSYSYGFAPSFAPGGVPSCVRPLVVATQLTGDEQDHVVVSIAHPDGEADTVAVLYKDGAPVAQSAPVTGGGSGDTAPLGPLQPGTYQAKACQVDDGGDYPTQCCEAGEGITFTISASKR
jgi:hypothetical protein